METVEARKMNVLLVDDDRIYNFLNEHTVKAIGLANHIYVALNGREALEMFSKYLKGLIEFPELILLDLNMPIMNGFEFIEAFEKLNLPNKDKIKIIVVTSSEDPKDLQRAKNLGMKHYLNKPITPDALRTIVNLN
jgi:CheY-like chemotaxis protein